MSEPAPEGTVAIHQHEIAREEFIPSLTIRDKKNHRWEIAANAVANRAHGQIIVSKLRTLYEKTLDDMLKITESGVPMDPKAMKDITGAGKTIQEMSILAYEGKGLGEKAQSDLERLAIAMVRAGTEGAAKGGANSYERRRELLAALGKKKQYPSKIIDVTPAPVDLDE